MIRMKRRVRLVAGVLAACTSGSLAAQEMRLPAMPNSVRFLVLGDAGTGERSQYEVAAQIVRWYAEFPFTFAIMLGDNIYGQERPQDFARKFERPYKPLLDAGVKFYAALGNHDDPNQRYYEPFHMDGKRFYAFSRGAVRFFALDSNYMDRNQLEWLERELERSSDEWKIAFFHHPLYSTGARHGSEVDLRQQLEPLFVQHSMDVVFAGHEHFYERVKPQHGIHHFVSGAAAKLRRGNIRGGESSAAGFDTDYSFMLVEIADRTLYFQAISNAGTRVDDGAFHPVPSRRTATTP
jgi:predicted phosphodiesterase